MQEEEDVLAQVEENPELSIRRLSAATGISRRSVSNILHIQQLYPYHFTPVQNLLPVDLPARLNFCQWLRTQQTNDPTFFSRILFTDEASFNRHGVFNWRNSHTWAEENPHLSLSNHFQHQFSINVWCGIVGDYVLGPYELPPRLNGPLYLHFLENVLYTLLDDVPLNVRRNMWFMQDGAPAHYSLDVRNHLDQRFPRRWIGRGSAFPWPSRSPDLNPLDFFLWGCMKDIVYKHTVNTREELWLRIQEAGNEIKNDPDTLFRVRQNLSKRCRKCIEVNGGHIENLLH